MGTIVDYLNGFAYRCVMSDVLQVEGFGSDIKNTISLVLCESASHLWIPYEFLSDTPVTRIFLYGEQSAGTRSLIAGEDWNITMCMTGAVGGRSWSLLASMMKHMISPVLLVIAPDVGVPPAVVPHFGRETTTVLFRYLSEVGALISEAHPAVQTVFFPVNANSGQIMAVQRWLWKGLPLRTSDTNLGPILQMTKPKGLCLVSSILENEIVTLSWYTTAESDQLVLAERRNSTALWLSAISDSILRLLRKDET
jgi:hypothetical protein